MGRRENGSYECTNSWMWMYKDFQWAVTSLYDSALHFFLQMTGTHEKGQMIRMWPNKCWFNSASPALLFLRVQLSACPLGRCGWEELLLSSVWPGTWFPTFAYTHEAVLELGSVVAARHGAATEPQRVGRLKVTWDRDSKISCKPQNIQLSPNIFKYTLGKKPSKRAEHSFTTGNFVLFVYLVTQY